MSDQTVLLPKLYPHGRIIGFGDQSLCERNAFEEQKKKTVTEIWVIRVCQRIL